MQIHHWVMMAIVIIIGMVIQKYFDPLGKIGM